MSDGTEQSGTEPSGTEAERTGEVTVPESARVVLPDDASTDGAGSAEEERQRAERATDDGEITPSDPSQPMEATPPANLAEPLR